MGIHGFMNYVRKYPNLLATHFLHGEYLVIDGHNVAAGLYGKALGDATFGGDYDSYSRTVERFFDELQKCDVDPLVILNGGDESIDIKNMIDSKKKRLEPFINFDPAKPGRTRILPLSLMIVFKSILKKKGVKIVRCVGKADPSIAGVANALKCHVLTFESKLFVYGVQCVPRDSLQPSIEKYSSNERSYWKECKVFKPEVLSKLFRNLPISMLPLLTVLLTNKYIKDSTIFEEFFSSLERPTYDPHRLYNDEQRKIEATLFWLSHYNIHEAIAALLETIPREHRKCITKIIENVIDEHTNLPCDLLKTLGLDMVYEFTMRAKLDYKKFEYSGKINDDEANGISWREKNTFWYENSPEKNNEETEIKIYNHLGCRNKDIINSWPSWFTHELETAESPSYYINLMFHRFFGVPFRVEVWTCPSAMDMSLKIVRVIDGLLVAGREESSCGLMILTRYEEEIATRLVDTLRGTKSTKFPPLSDLRETSMKMRKQIFEDTLEFSGEEIADLPDKWKLYFAVILFWMEQNDEPLRNSCHMRAVIFTMLLGVIDGEIGYQRSLYTLNGGPAKEIVEHEQACTELTMETKGDSIKDALGKVTKSDCLNAASFFIKNYQMDRKLCHGSKKFNATTVHVFMQFEACLKHAIDLNRLLECPYEAPKIEELCNATMIYNLCEKFESQRNVENFIARTLTKAPNLLHLVNLLNAKAQKILDTRSKVLSTD